MIARHLQPASALLLSLSLTASATTRYVDLNCTNATPPFTNWDIAAVTIQDAIDAADPGDQIWVTNGIYATGGRVVSPYLLTNRVVVDKAVTVQSFNGPEVTVIQGYQVPGTTNGDSAIRCVHLANGATLIGFTLTNGATLATYFNAGSDSGGGVWCESTNAFLSNCVLTANSAYGYGGGAYSGTVRDCAISSNSAHSLSVGAGGGACASTLIRCALTGNSAYMTGGGACSNTLVDCTLTGNYASAGGGTSRSTLTNCTLSYNSAGGGGGATISTLIDCRLTSNSAWWRGGGVSGSTLNGCTLMSNSCDEEGGGAHGSTLSNCTLAGNSANQGGGAFGGIFFCNLINCVVSSNSAAYGGGAYGCGVTNSTFTGNWVTNSGGAAYRCSVRNSTIAGNAATNSSGAADKCTVYNCILYFNTASTNPNSSDGLKYCCTTPLPATGAGNFTNEPIFVDYANGNLRLQSNSPCINAGTNFYAPSGPDLDGNPRIVAGTVDMGAYEHQSPALTPFFSWQEGFGLPTYLYADADTDGMSDLKEWRCGTNPTNAASLLRLLTPGTSASGLAVTWESVTNRSYFLERGTNMSGQPPFSLLATNVSGQLGTTSYTDTNAPGRRLFYYRVGVQ